MTLLMVNRENSRVSSRVSTEVVIVAFWWRSLKQMGIDTDVTPRDISRIARFLWPEQEMPLEAVCNQSTEIHDALLKRFPGLAGCSLPVSVTNEVFPAWLKEQTGRIWPHASFVTIFPVETAEIFRTTDGTDSGFASG